VSRTLDSEIVTDSSSYLTSESSLPLKVLLLVRSSMTVNDVAKIFGAMKHSQTQRVDRQELHVDVTGIYFSTLEPVSTELAQGQGPSSLSMKQLDFKDESEFIHLLQAVKTSTNLHALGIGEAIFPSEISSYASEELQSMLSDNRTLELLDLSGENSRIESSSMGAGLCTALLGLKENTTLRALGIRDQRLGMEGAKVLAEVLATNSSLMAIHCERNNIPLAGVGLITDVLQHNTSVVTISGLEDGRSQALSKIHVAVPTLKAPDGPLKSSGTLKSKFSKTQKEKIPIPPDLAAARELVAEKWDLLLEELYRLLDRNRRIALGDTLEEECVTNGAVSPGILQMDRRGLLERTESLDEAMFETVKTALADITVIADMTAKNSSEEDLSSEEHLSSQENLSAESSWLDLS
jgi:hypothetical protein